MEQKRCISSLTLAELTAALKAMGQPGFRAKQIFHWVHQKLVTEFSAMTDQPKTLLAKLEEQFYIAAPKIERRQEAKDGTVKYLLRMADGNCIETVVMRYHYGNTVCVSTQVGCRMGCRFCASTQAGRVRNLEAGEICSEIYTAQKDIGERISHIVLMGIGGPLDNFDEVMRFLENISSPEGVNIGMRNISLSTCGLVPKIDQLAEKKLQLTLSVSLHAPNNEIRSGMMPVNDAYPVEVLMQAVRRYQETTGRRVSFEYSMVRGVNDSDACAKQLADVVGQRAADRQDEPCRPHRQKIVQHPHHRKGQKPAAQREEARRKAGNQKDEQRLEQVQHQCLLSSHEKQRIHHHNIRQTQFHTRQKPGDDQCALDEGKRHRQSKQQT